MNRTMVSGKKINLRRTFSPYLAGIMAFQTETWEFSVISQDNTKNPLNMERWVLCNVLNSLRVSGVAPGGRRRGQAGVELGGCALMGGGGGVPPPGVLMVWKSQ